MNAEATAAWKETMAARTAHRIAVAKLGVIIAGPALGSPEHAEALREVNETFKKEATARDAYYLQRATSDVR